MKKDKKPGFLETIINENPVGAYSALGALQALINKPKEAAAANAEVVRSQYSPWLKGGPGDMSRVKQKSVLDQALAGAMSGYIQKKDDEYNRKVLDALLEKRTPVRKPGSLKIEQPSKVEELIMKAPEETAPVFEKIVKPERNYEVPGMFAEPKTYNQSTGFNNYQNDYQAQLTDALLGRMGAGKSLSIDPRNIPQKVRDQKLSIKGGF